MGHSDNRKKLQAAQALFLEDTTTREKFTHVSELIKGIHPKIDVALEECNKALSTIEKAYNLQLVDLTAENLPENTEEQKKRKNAILFFIRSWRHLQSELTRVTNEMQDSQEADNTPGKARHWGRILGSMKGPLGLITVIAIGLGAMQVTSVQLTIENRGCGTLQPSGGLPFPIPGLSLPSEAIKSGDTATATLPPLHLTIDGTKKGSLSLHSLGFDLGIQLPSNIRDVTLDKKSLLGKTSDVHLSESKEHAIVLACAS